MKKSCVHNAILLKYTLDQRTLVKTLVRTLIKTLVRSLVRTFLRPLMKILVRVHTDSSNPKKKKFLEREKLDKCRRGVIDTSTSNLVTWITFQDHC